MRSLWPRQRYAQPIIETSVKFERPSKPCRARIAYPSGISSLLGYHRRFPRPVQNLDRHCNPWIIQRPQLGGIRPIKVDRSFACLEGARHRDRSKRILERTVVTVTSITTDGFPK